MSFKTEITIEIPPYRLGLGKSVKYGHARPVKTGCCRQASAFWCRPGQCRPGRLCSKSTNHVVSLVLI